MAEMNIDITNVIELAIEKIRHEGYTVQKWISCAEKLPLPNEIVWICLYWEKDAYVRKGYIKNEVWYTADGYRMCITPKFWMYEYIPEPPEKE